MEMELFGSIRLGETGNLGNFELASIGNFVNLLSIFQEPSVRPIELLF